MMVVVCPGCGTRSLGVSDAAADGQPALALPVDTAVAEGGSEAPDAGADPVPDVAADLAAAVEAGQPPAGDGSAPVAELFIYPAVQRFSTAVGEQSARTRLVVGSLGTVSTGVPVVALTGEHPSEFAVVGHTCTAPLTPHGNCGVEVIFRPTSFGERTATLTVTASPGGTGTAKLVGFGFVPEAPDPEPRSLDFGTVAVGTTSQAMVMKLPNHGSAASPPIMVSLSSVEFVKSHDTCSGASVPPLGSCVVAVQLRPMSRGAKSAVIVFDAGPGGKSVGSLSGSAQ
jgi:hypothetical protein